MEICAINELGELTFLNSFKEADELLERGVYKRIIYRETPFSTIKIYK